MQYAFPSFSKNPGTGIRVAALIVSANESNHFQLFLSSCGVLRHRHPEALTLGFKQAAAVCAEEVLGVPGLVQRCQDVLVKPAKDRGVTPHFFCQLIGGGLTGLVRFGAGRVINEDRDTSSESQERLFYSWINAFEEHTRGIERPCVILLAWMTSHVENSCTSMDVYGGIFEDPI